MKFAVGHWTYYFIISLLKVVRIFFKIPRLPLRITTHQKKISIRMVTMKEW